MMSPDRASFAGAHDCTRDGRKVKATGQKKL